MSERANHIETAAEEACSSATHWLGAILSAAGLLALVTLAARRGGALLLATVTVFGLSLVGVYLVSALYHACRDGRAKRRLRTLDHIAIYALIAGTYTPFLLVVVRGPWGWGLFAVLWALAVAGTVFKWFFVDRFGLASTLVYVAMGWIGLVALRPFMANLPQGAMPWLLAGGASYTGGVAFYLWDRLPFNHAVWHLFVMAGSACHFLAVLWYVVGVR